MKPREVDIWVSGYILDRGVWEEEEVTAIMRMMDVYQEATFLDLGANIGGMTIDNNFFKLPKHQGCTQSWLLQ